MIPDRTSEHTLSHLARLADYDIDQLIAVSDDAAHDFAMLTLWRELPPEDQGARDKHSWAIRDQRAECAKKLWLAVRTEMKARDRAERQRAC